MNAISLFSRLGPVVAAVLLASVGSAHAALQFVNLGSSGPVPPSDIGGIAVTPFDVSPQAAIPDNTSNVTTISGSPIAGSLSVSPGVRKYTMPDGGSTTIWENGYTGPVFLSTAAATTLTLPAGVTAFYLHVEPYLEGTYTIGISATSSLGPGEDGTGSFSATTVATPSTSTIPTVGFHADAAGETITSVTLTIPADADGGPAGLLVAAFGLGTEDPVPGECGSAAGVPVTRAPSVGLCEVGDASAPSGAGPWSWSCQGQSGGRAAQCTAPRASVPPPVAVPTLSVWGNWLMALAAAGLGVRRLRRKHG